MSMKWCKCVQWTDGLDKNWVHFHASGFLVFLNTPARSVINQLWVYPDNEYPMNATTILLNPDYNKAIEEAEIFKSVLEYKHEA